MPTYGTPTSAAMNTSSTNDLSGDGYTWADINAFIVDNFGKLIIAVQKNGGGSHTNNFVYSNDNGSTWTDGAGSYSFLNRAGLAYDTTNDILHAFWVGIDMTSGEGFIYRRYTISRDGSHNITAITADGTTNLQLDFDTSGTATMNGDFPKLAWLNDAAYGTYGALLATWSVDQTNGTGGKIQGYEYRTSMCVFGSTATQGATAGNWAAPTGTGDSSILGTGTTPQVAYNRIAGRTGASNVLVGSYGYARKQANSHAKDLYYFYFDANGLTSGGQWAYRRLQWASGSNNWANGLTAVQSLSVNTVSGTDTGYALKYQLATQVAEDTTGDFVYFGSPIWNGNTLGDSSCFWRINSADSPSATTVIYSANGAHVYAPTQDLMYDQAGSRLIVTYDQTGASDHNYGLYATYNGLTLDQAGQTINTTHGCDIPLLLSSRYTGGATPKIIGAFRYTLNTPTPPYTGLFYSIPISSAAQSVGSLAMV